MAKRKSKLKKLNEELNKRANYISERLGLLKSSILIIIVMFMSSNIINLIFFMVVGSNRFGVLIIIRLILSLILCFIFYYKYTYEILKGHKPTKKGVTTI